ncbi:tetratricopeptide repeat protein [bacterium]|nr:tetratricopeptide repeat protein [bacterium]
MLRPRKRITRKEIKEDALVTTYFKIRKYVQKHSRYLTIVLLAIPVIIIVAMMMVKSKRDAELTAYARLGVVIQPYHLSDYSTSIGELTQIVDAYPGTKAAGEAVFFLGNSYFNMGNYVQAETYYQLYIDDYSDNDLFSISSMAGVAACHAAQDRFYEAALQYEKAANRYSNLFNAPFYLKDAARCYRLADDVEKAKMAYQVIVDRYPNSDLKDEVEFILESL